MAWAAPLDFGFKSPSFNGIGYSSHVLTIENQEHSRTKERADAIQAALDREAANTKNTNIAKFMNNLESRIYAQLSLQMSNAMFSGTATTGSLDFQGTTINWVKDSAAQTITLNIIDPNGNATNIVVPIGSFAF